MSRAILIGLMLMGLAVPAAGQAGLRLYGHVGPAAPLGPNSFVDFWKPGTEVGLGVGWAVRGPFEVLLEGLYQRFPLERDEFLADAGVLGVGLDLRGGAFTVGGLMLGVRANLEQSRLFAPYVALRAGVMRRNRSDLTLAVEDEAITLEGDAETTLGVGASVGVGVILGPRLHLYAAPAFYVLASRFRKPSFNRLPRAEDNLTRYFGLRVGLRLAR
ncbi:MAG: hypothetical protein KatS3mg044_1471 [Rhodothermaceae bacterium]|nr:MAG: hypothetical protein KatS3mg044_1471 [Rhodothermaceae bacterium]